MSSIVLVLLEARDDDAERLLTAVSEGGVGARVHRVTTREALRSEIDRGGVDAVVARAPGCDPISVVGDARDLAPVILVAGDPLDDAFDWLAAGAAACVPARRLDRLAPAIARAVAEARRQREEATAARRRDEFLARVAHQLRTPQGALLGWTALLAGNRLDEGGRARALDTIARNARIQARMVEDLLDVSRIISRSLELDLVRTELCPAVAAALDAAHPLAEAAGVTLGAELDDGAGSADVDPRRLDQVVRELLANAVRATPRGGRVDLRLRRDGAAASITIRDTGRGLGAEALAHVFDGLRRVDRPAHHGLGVGLWIARALVEAHGGRIEAESLGEGLGATFTVRLPASAR